jgi:hypothetical protein
MVTGFFFFFFFWLKSCCDLILINEYFNLGYGFYDSRIKRILCIFYVFILSIEILLFHLL